MTAKSDQDPDPHGSALVRQCLPEDGFGSALEPMRIYNTGMYANGFQNVLMAYCNPSVSYLFALGGGETLAEQQWQHHSVPAEVWWTQTGP